MIKLYPQKNLTVEKRIFGYRQSRMRMNFENDLETLTNHWRVFRKPFSLEPEKVKMLTLATITFHNLFRKD